MGFVPKGDPPDKSVGAWPSVQEKTTGIGNVGKSPGGGTNAENQSIKGQGNLREHPVANQEDISTGELSGIYPLPRPRSVPLSVAHSLKERNSMLLTEEGLCNHHSLSTLEHESDVIAEELVKSIPETEMIRTAELFRKIVRPLSSNYQDALQSFYACHSTTAEFGMSDSEMEEMEVKRTVE